MANKSAPSSSGDRSKVRLLYVDADMAAGDMSSLTNALMAAIRPTHVVGRTGSVQQIAPPAPTTADSNGHGKGTPDGEQTELLEEEPIASEEPSMPAAKAARSGPRPYRKLNIVEMDMNSGDDSWMDFAKRKDPGSHRAKHLVAATWLHDNRKLETITVDHIFTCYKFADWIWDVSGDPTTVLRDLKKASLGALTQGKFTINQLGLAEVQKMKVSA